MLGRGQRVHIACTEDVAAKILRLNGLSQKQRIKPKHVMQWVMQNTAQESLLGISAWASQGAFFASTLEDASYAKQDEDVSLLGLYGPGRTLQSLSSVVKEMIQAKERRSLKRKIKAEGGGEAVKIEADAWNFPSTWAKGGDPEKRRRMPVDLEMEVQAQSSKLGEGHMIMSSRGGAGADEECERELEREEEEEEEQETETPSMSPEPEEIDWDYTSILDAESVTSLSSGAGVKDLTIAVLNGLCLGINWAGHGLFCTRNFAATVNASITGSNSYLRPVRSMLFFPSSKQVLLLSERESDSALECVYRIKHSAKISAVASHSSPLLLNLSYAADAACKIKLKMAVSMSKTGQFLLPPGALFACTPLPSVSALVRLLLFDGETVYGSDGLKKALHALVRRRKTEIESMVSMRGRETMLSRSHLELACEEVMLL